MGKLSNISGKVKTVNVAGVNLHVRGLTVREIGQLLDERRAELESIQARMQSEDIAIVDIVTQAADLAAHVAALVTGEDKADIESLTIGDQVLILQAAVEATLPGESKAVVLSLWERAQK
jgi:hypothetical protein